MDPTATSSPVNIILYTRPASDECVRVLDLLQQLSARHNFRVKEAASPEGAPAPCVRFVVPGAPFHNADGISEAQFLEYLEAARTAVTAPETTPKGEQESRKAKSKPKAGSLPTPAYEASHPVRSFFWRHR